MTSLRQTCSALRGTADGGTSYDAPATTMSLYTLDVVFDKDVRMSAITCNCVHMWTRLLCTELPRGYCPAAQLETNRQLLRSERVNV